MQGLNHMGIKEAYRALVSKPDASTAAAKLKTRLAVGKQDAAATLFDTKARTPERIKKLRNIYQQGGIVSMAVDVHPIFATMNGYRLD
jgi:hypothetical protein